jgi:hypothetical protein
MCKDGEEQVRERERQEAGHQEEVGNEPLVPEASEHQVGREETDHRLDRVENQVELGIAIRDL